MLHKTRKFKKILDNTVTCILLCGLLDGCSVRSTYHSPLVDMPNQWPHALTKSEEHTLNLKKMYWWKQYHDPILDRLIYKALSQNNDLKKSIANIEYAQKELTQVKLNWLPTASILGGFSQFPIFANPGGFAMAAPLYIINILQQFQEQKSSQAKLAYSVYAKDAAILTIIAQVATSYFTVIAEQQALILYQRWLEDMQTYYRLAQTQYRAGLISKDALMIIQNRIENVRSQLAIVRNNIVISQNALHVLLNENPGNMYYAHNAFQKLRTGSVVPANLPCNVIRNRPDIRQQDALLRSAYANVDSAIAALFPSITVGAYLGSGTTSHGPFYLLESYPSLPIDLKLYPQIGSNQARYKAIYFDYINTIRIALRDIDNSLSTYYQRTEQLDHLIQALNYEMQHCYLTKKRFQHGLVNQIEVRRCEIKLDEMRVFINRTKLEKILSIVKLYQEMAGGYRVV